MQGERLVEAYELRVAAAHLDRGLGLGLGLGGSERTGGLVQRAEQYCSSSSACVLVLVYAYTPHGSKFL